MSGSRRYGLLRAIAFVLKLLAWVALLAGIAAALLSLVTIALPGNPALSWWDTVRVLGVSVAPLVGIIWFVQLYAFGSILSLLIDIEENTRILALYSTGTAPPPEESTPTR